MGGWVGGWVCIWFFLWSLKLVIVLTYIQMTNLLTFSCGWRRFARRKAVSMLNAKYFIWAVTSLLLLTELLKMITGRPHLSKLFLFLFFLIGEVGEWVRGRRFDWIYGWGRRRRRLE